MRRARCRAILAAAVLLATLEARAQGGARRATPTREAVAYGLALAPGDPAPEFVAADLAGRRVEVAYGEHAATLVGLWSSECVPCRVQVPALQKLFAERGGEGLQVIGLATDIGTPNKVIPAVRAFVAELGVSYPVMRLSTQVEKAWHGVRAIPTTFLVGRDGKLLRRYVGADDAIVAGLVADVEACLAGRPLGDQVMPAGPEDAPSPR